MIETIGSVLFNKAKALLGFAALFVLLEWKFPAKRNQKLIRADSRLDLTYSFLLILIFIPVQIACAPVFARYFHGALTMPQEFAAGRVQAEFVQKPEKGQASVLPDGSVTYRAHSAFNGSDTFVLKKSDGENHLTQTFIAKVETQTSSAGVALPNPHKRVTLQVTSSVLSGRVTEGVTGGFWQARNWILNQNLILQIVLAVLIVDFVGYWRHRFMHTRFFWPFHTIHHSSRQVDWLSTERFHPVNHYISATLNLLVLTALFQDPYVGGVAMFLRRGYGLFVHANIPVSYGFLDRVFVSPRFHRWHHSDSATVAKKNYATFFSCFDLLFGTYYLPKDKTEPQTFGFHGGELHGGLIRQFLYPFVQLAAPRRAPVQA